MKTDMFTALSTEELFALREFLIMQARKLTRNEHDAEDLVSETFLKAWKSRNLFDGNNVKGWLYVILKNTHITEWQKKKKKQEWLQRHPLKTQHKINEGPHLLDYKIYLQAIERLPAKQQASLMLIVEGYQYTEASIKLGIPEGTVKSCVFQARKLLRAELCEQDMAMKRRVFESRRMAEARLATRRDPEIERSVFESRRLAEKMLLKK